MERSKFAVIMPIAEQDIDIALFNIDYIKKNIKPERIYIIANKKLKELIQEKNNCIWIDENEMYPGLDFASVANIMKERTGNSERSGWYFQQFLKMAFSYVAEEDYYLIWDADTVPLREISFFGERIGKPLLAYKTEYNKPYFDTMYRLIGMGKVIEASFIAEHMLINKEIMKELIQDIEDNDTLQGTQFFEKIMYAVDERELKKSGFSEFETYGTYAYNKYPNKYDFRILRTLRNGQKHIGKNRTQNILEWLAKDYDTISFEKWQIPFKSSAIVKFRIVRKIIKASVYVNLSNKIHRR